MTSSQPVVEPEYPENITVDWLEQQNVSEKPAPYPLWGWAMRLITLCCLMTVIYLTIVTGLGYGDAMVVYSTLMPFHTLLVFFLAWIPFQTKLNTSTRGDLVSVIIPVYNQVEMIETVIEAIINSTYCNLEVIAVDDGSKDNTLSLLSTLSEKYPVVVLRHEVN